MSHRFESRAGWTAATVIVLAVTAVWIGCSDSPPTPIGPDAEVDRAVDLAQQPDLTPALRAQRRHGAALLRIPGVVGHGIGVDDDGHPTITVFTLRRGVEGIPSRLDRVPTRTVVSGPFVVGELTARLRPAPNGYSIGHPDITAGTVGAVVQDGGGVCHALSNNHVLANSNDASIGDSALQPGPFDGGSDPTDAIGALADFEPIQFDGSPNTIDAAIARVFTPVADFVTAETPDFTPSGATVDASVGQAVKKTGRTTEFTTGEVTEVNVTVDVCYECAGPFCFNCKKLARFENQIGTSDMSDGGDSGSLIVDSGSNDSVGLLFAGSDTRTLANPIGAVLTRFGAAVIQPGDLSSCTNGESVDNPPSVTVTNPSDGATVSGTVTVTADTSDDEGVSQVEFFVDGSSIGVDSDGSDGWSASWDTTSETEGSHDVSATATDTGGQTASDTVTVTVDNVEDPAGVTVDGIDPSSMAAGTTVDVTITGSGFVDTPSVSFENGSGPAPEASNEAFVDSTTITATVTAKSGGPPRNRVWDVRVTNPDGSSGVLTDGFTVTP